MGSGCVLKVCSSRFSGKSARGRVHSFPSNNVFQRRKWERWVIAQNRNTNFKSYRGAALCSDHFCKKTCFKPNGRLKADAVPTIAPECTPEMAFQFGWIPTLNSDLLQKGSTCPLPDGEGASFERVSEIRPAPNSTAEGLPEVTKECKGPIIVKVVSLVQDGQLPEEAGTAGCVVRQDQGLQNSVNIPPQPSFRKTAPAPQALKSWSNAEDQGLQNSVNISLKTFRNTAPGPPAHKSHQKNVFTDIPASPSFRHDQGLQDSVNISPKTSSQKIYPAQACDSQDSVSTDTPLPMEQAYKTLLTSCRKAYVGDLSPEDFTTPLDREKNLKSVKDTVSKLRSRLKLSQQSLRRAKQQISNLQLTISALKAKHFEEMTRMKSTMTSNRRKIDLRRTELSKQEHSYHLNQFSNVKNGGTLEEAPDIPPTTGQQKRIKTTKKGSVKKIFGSVVHQDNLILPSVDENSSIITINWTGIEVEETSTHDKGEKNNMEPSIQETEVITHEAVSTTSED